MSSVNQQTCIESGCDQVATSGQPGWRRCRVHHNARKHAMRRRKRLAADRFDPELVKRLDGE